jgi:hypothetical protein
MHTSSFGFQGNISVMLESKMMRLIHLFRLGCFRRYLLGNLMLHFCCNVDDFIEIDHKEYSLQQKCNFTPLYDTKTNNANANEWRLGLMTLTLSE